MQSARSLADRTLDAIDANAAITACRIATEQDPQSAAAMYFLAQAYHAADEVGEAVEWYQKAAEKGDARAQYEIALRYDVGDGVALDDAEAVKWYRAAAEQGNAEAQNRLGLKYDFGEGTALDDA